AGITSRGLGQDFVPYEEKIPDAQHSIEMVPVEGGTFMMGSSDGEEDEAPPHKVMVDNFWMGKYEITWQQYDEFVEEKIDNVNPPTGAEVEIQADAVSLPTPPYIDMSFGMGR